MRPWSTSDSSRCRSSGPDRRSSPPSSSGRRLVNHASRAAKSGSSSSTRLGRCGNGEQRQQPDQRAHPQRLVAPVGSYEHVVEEAVLVVPQAGVLRAEALHAPGRSTGSAPGTWWRCRPRPGSSWASSSAMRSIARQKNAIQLVASDCSSRYPGGGGAERSKKPMLSIPRNPPSNRLDPSASLRLTHQLKFSSSLVNTRMRNSRSRLPSITVDLPGRPGVHRRIDVAERPFVGGQLPVWVHRPLSTRAAPVAPWRTSGSTWASATQWNARSQAANHGYSHSSGMEMTSARARCCQAALRAGPSLPAAGVGSSGSPSSHSSDVEPVELFAPQQAGEGAAGDEPVLLGQPVRITRSGRTRRPRRAGRRGPRRSSRPNMSLFRARCGDSRSRTATVHPARPRRSRTRTPPWCRNRRVAPL